jgi:hypothetical protein
MFNNTSDGTFGANTNINGYFTDNNCTIFPGNLTSGTTLTTGTTIYGGLTLNNNGTSMNQQVKVAVFRVERNKHNEIKSSTFLDEYWIEKKPGVSIDYAVALELQSRGLGKTKADEIVIKEIYTVTL